MSRILYKYLDIEGGKLMLANHNLQFTNASQQNDPFDCHPNLIDYSDVPESFCQGKPEWVQEQEEKDAMYRRDDTWLSCLSKVNDSLLMWSHYCRNHSGICIGVDIDKVLANVPSMFGVNFERPYLYEVQYQKIIQRPNAYKSWEDVLRYQWSTKAEDWIYEEEMRLVMENPNPWYAMMSKEQRECEERGEEIDWKEIKFYLPLTGDSFESIYFGVKTDVAAKDKIINFARTKLNPNIKLFQMKVDENAFRLKAEPIN